MVNSGADIYIDPPLGPKAMNVLSASTMRLFEGIHGKTVRENLALFKDGKLKKCEGQAKFLA